MHYYQFNIGDYARDTQHLEPMEDLAYRRMLDLYYQREMPLPKTVEEIARLTRMRAHSECIAIVLEEFWELTDNGYINNGADKVLNKAYSKSESARLAAQARWNKIKGLDNADALQTDSESNADGMPPNTQDTLPNTHNPKPKKKGVDFSALQMTDEQLNDLKAHRQKVKAPLTQRAVNGLAKQLELAKQKNWTIDDVLDEMSERGWKSFKAEWIAAKPNQFYQQQPQESVDRRPTEEDLKSWLK